MNFRPSPTDHDAAGFLAVRVTVSAVCAVILWGGILILSL